MRFSPRTWLHWFLACERASELNGTESWDRVHLHTQIGEVLDARLAAGYFGMSPQDIWSRLDAEARAVPSVFRQINEVKAAKGM